MLHGAIGSSSQLEPVANLLTDTFKISLLNFSGHGGKPISEKPFSIQMFAEDVLYFIDRNKFGKTDIYGYSMGGYVALYIARNFPEKINRIFTTATKFNWNEETAIKESKMLDAEKIIQKVPKFAEQLSQRHSPEDWRVVLNKTAEMMLNLGSNRVLKVEDLEKIENEVLISVGDHDTMVTIEETVDAYRKLKYGKLLIIPGTPHPIEKIAANRIANEIKLFFDN